jgi:hypothetical protein
MRIWCIEIGNIYRFKLNWLLYALTNLRFSPLIYLTCQLVSWKKNATLILSFISKEFMFFSQIQNINYVNTLNVKRLERRTYWQTRQIVLLVKDFSPQFYTCSFLIIWKLKDTSTSLTNDGASKKFLSPIVYLHFLIIWKMKNCRSFHSLVFGNHQTYMPPI